MFRKEAGTRDMNAGIDGSWKVFKVLKKDITSWRGNVERKKKRV